MNELQLTPEQEYKLSCAKDFVERTREDIKSVTKSFFSIGFRLNEANEMKYFENLSYPNIESLAEEEFGFKRSTTYGLIKVFRLFCIKRDCGYVGVICTNTIQEEFKDYSYSQLLEISKCNYIPTPVRNYIPVSSSVRDIAAYVSEYNNPKINVRGTLPEWKEKKREEQETNTLNILPSDSENVKKVKEILSFAKSISTEQQTPNKNNIDLPSSQEELNVPTAPVQTSGLQPCAEPAPKQEKQNNYSFNSQKYTLQNRTGVRNFFADYKNWYENKNFANFFFEKVYSCFLKNRTYIYACERKIYNGADLQLGKAVTKVTYYFNAFCGDGVSEISQNQFEQYCAEHKDEL